jgi:MerR family transcriptional regulator/heat shock protein HspR
MLDKGRPVYTIGTAAELLDVHPRTLRLYEDGGLLRPARKNNRRFYTSNDLEWIGCIRYLLHDKGLNQEGLKRLLAFIPCSEIRGCKPEDVENCSAYTERSAPCWDLARQAGSRVNECYQCSVYLAAPDHVLSPEERQEAMKYITHD